MYQQDRLPQAFGFHLCVRRQSFCQFVLRNVSAEQVRTSHRAFRGGRRSETEEMSTRQPENVHLSGSKIPPPSSVSDNETLSQYQIGLPAKVNLHAPPPRAAEVLRSRHVRLEKTLQSENAVLRYIIWYGKMYVGCRVVEGGV